MKTTLLAVAFFFSAALHSFSTTPEETALTSALTAAGHRFTPQVREAYLRSAKANALAEISAAGKSLPAGFLAWIDSDPIVRSTVYGAREKASNMLLLLRSLEIDLGEPAVRRDYTQLALAMAVVHAAKGPEADLSPRPLLKLVIPGDPRVPVNTNDPSRKLDRYDHIINFLNSTTIEEDVVVGQKEEPPPLRYDSRGIAIPPPKNAKNIKVPITEKRKRTLYAADVIASRDLQEKFNAYMKSKGEDVSIDCGEKIVFWKSTASVPKDQRKKINDALVLFRTAYEQKGLLPKARDAAPTPAESMAWWIRNNSYKFPDDVAKQRNWPRYPINAPWPTLTLLAADNQPLRERQERWEIFRDKGITRTYGEYIGPIAQQFDMQSARRIKPYPFQYGTYQMMDKDGGVCGTMANMGVRTYNTLGIPSCTAGQPGHCALILFDYDRKTGLYQCKGGQFATGGPEKTSPHTPWVFGDTDARRPMLHYQTIGWAVNYGMPAYLDTTIALQVFRALPETERKTHGITLLGSAFPLNPYNILLPEAIQAAADTPAAQIAFWKQFKETLAAVASPGCPKDGLYNTTIRAAFFKRVATLPVPSEAATAREVLTTLTAEKCDNAVALVNYQSALDGPEIVVGQTEKAYQAHLSGSRTPENCEFMAATLEAVAGKIPRSDARKQWLAARWRETQSHERYLGPKHKLLTDVCAARLAKLNRTKLPDDTTLNRPLLATLGKNFTTYLSSARTPATSKEMSGTIKAVAGQIKDSAQRQDWLAGLSTALAGKENYQHKGKSVADSCVSIVSSLLVEGKKS